MRNRAKLTDAAQQFEGMLLQEMLKPLASKNDDWSGDKSSDDEPSGGSDTISSFGVEAVAKSISKSGGLGIARQIVRQVTDEHDKMQAGKVSGGASRSPSMHKS
ncbi:MAG TPA: rod-binding protein [Edaphobacter sp.]|nr:rod-binding protein [Edaphobacter sp.]